MADLKALAQYIAEQLEPLEDIRYIPMMGGYIFYYKERIFGGIYDEFMVKITEASQRYMPESKAVPPYEGAKPMLPVTILEDRDVLQKMVVEMYPELPPPSKKKKRQKGSTSSKQ